MNLFIVNGISPYIKTFKIQNYNVNFELDSGSGVSIINNNIVKKLKCKVYQSTKRLFNYDEHEIIVLGQVLVNVEYKKHQYGKHVFYVVNENHVNICGRDLFEKIN